MPRDLEAIASQVRTCTLCGLCQGRTHAVPGSGSGRSGVMLVGEAPGRHEDESGLPFVGAAGKNLDLALATAGIAREEAFITSIVKCRPPGNRDPTEGEKEACRPHLLAQIEALRPRVIVALGRHGLHGLLGRMPDGFAALPGSFLEGPGGIPVWVSLHPAAIIYRQKWKASYLVQWKEFGEWLRSGRTAPVARADRPGGSGTSTLSSGPLPDGQHGRTPAPRPKARAKG